ncbi:GTPase family protein [Streptosporangium sandarakinum]|uniref:GTPase family protein n=1 Tax=Streptosporangium sandarakinum TaxID=1260955 RepID=UPI0033A8DB41
MKLLRRRITVSLDDRLDALAEAADLADGRLAPVAVAGARSVVARAGVRRSLSVDHTAVALAGATGSGKSSLFNLLSGTTLATVGVTRPTTSAAQAALWEGTGAGPLLDWLEISRRHEVDAGASDDAVTGGWASGEVPGLVLLDLPDHDSIEAAHRLEVDRLVELVDLLVWVLDPQKYADAAVHDRYLRPLSRHRDVTVVVLNQIDRLSPAAVERCLKDLRRLLDDDGLAGVPLVAVSARTGEGVDELRSLLASRVANRRSWAARLAADVGTASDALALASSGAGLHDGESVMAGTDLYAGGPGSGPGSSSGSGPGSGPSPGSGSGPGSRLGGGPAFGVVRDAGASATGSVEVTPPPEVSLDDLAGPLTGALSEAAGVPVVVAAVAKSHRHRSVAATGWPPTRWIRRLRPDPLRRLRLGLPAPSATRGAGAETPEGGGPVGRTSIPATSAVQRSRMDTAVREAAGTASEGLPEPWAAAVRQAARARADELEDGLDRAVATTSLGVSGRPAWWRAAGLAQWLVLLVALSGALWLLGLVAMDYLRLPRPYLPTAGELPWPTLLLLGGVLLGLVIALLCRVAAWLGGRRRARRASRALRASVGQVAREFVLDPVGEELTRYRRFTEMIAVARGASR